MSESLMFEHGRGVDWVEAYLVGILDARPKPLMMSAMIAS
jgi:hypothetical protein